MRVLVAEDDTTSRLLIGAVLSKWSFQVQPAADGNEAWDILTEDDPPQLLILDWEMPGIEGIEICRRVRDRESKNPPYIIMLTGRGSKEDIVLGLEAGANDYISKPFDNDELRARVKVGERVLMLQNELSDKIVELQGALDHIKTLQGILPICMHCHKISEDRDIWQRLEEYVVDHSKLKFSHGLCPDCYEKYYPEIKKKKRG